MAAPCGVSLHVCRMRITRLLATGAVDAGADGKFVSADLLSVGLTPTIEQGADLTLTGGCDCVIASYRGEDKLKRFEIELSIPGLAAAMYEMLMGATLITGTYGTDTGVPIGIGWPAPLDCGEAAVNNAFEFWTDHWNGDALDPDLPYVHHVYPQSKWAPGQQSYGNDFAQPTLAGFTRGNLAWNDGPHGDGPGVDIPYGGWFYTADALPAADCDYQSVA